MARKKNDYWAKRDAAEKAWMASQLAKDERFNKTLGRTYQIALDNINRSIRADIDRIGGVQNLVTADQMAEYERLAQQAVEKANKLRQAGKTVRYEDFSPYVNERLKVYNATMRVNQQEMLKSQIGAQLVNVGIDVDTAIHDKVYEDYLKEKERQAGILKLSTSGRPSASVIDQTTGSIAVGHFSKNVWANVDLLKAQLDGVIATGFIAGDNPRKIARQLIDQVSDKFANARYAAERIARTESARMEYKAQLESVLENGYKYVRWYLEPSACRTCREIGESGDVKGYDDVYKVDTVPEVPVHPNCRCSIGAYWVDEEDTINSGAVRKDMEHIRDFDALSDEDSKAKTIYLELGQRDATYAGKLIAKAGNMTAEEGKQVFNHIFREKHKFNSPLDDKEEYRYFDPDYDMAKSFIRILNRQKLLERDIILVKHELIESNIMSKDPSITYEKAHDLANKKFNYENKVSRK